MEEQVAKTKQFLYKQQLTLGKSLTDYELNEYLDEIACELLTTSTFIENMLSKNADSRLERVHMLIEELGETVLGLAHCNEIKTLDSLSDLIFVAIGVALAFDLPIVEGLNEVCDSNLTKSPRTNDDPRCRDKGPNYRPPNLKKVISLYRGVEVRAFRTDCCTGLKKETTVLVKKYHGTGLLLTKGGVTGYESIEISKIPERLDKGWIACMGTPDRWDELFLPGDSMREISTWLKETE